MTNDLAHPGSESPVMVIKPPERRFTELAPVEIPDPGPQNGPADYTLAAAGRRWTLSITPYGAALLRLRLSPVDGGTEPDQGASWAVDELPSEEPGSPYSVDASAVLSPGAPAGATEKTTAGATEGTPGALRIGPWEAHPEALRFTLLFDGEPEIYGLGEKTGRLERSGRVWEMWNSDDPFHLPSKDPLYVSIPFAMFHREGRWFALFLDSPGRQYWDTREPGRVVIDVEDEQLDLYLFSAPGPRELLTAYTALTGRPPLPPVWALGYHQSRYSYYPEENVRALADRFRREELPGDVIHLDIDYMRGYRVFTWDPERFPDPATLVADLRKQGFRVVTIVDPGVKLDAAYAIYREGEARGHFCRYPDGRTYVGKVWPGEAVFPDFSREATRRWWAQSHKPLFDAGVAGIWNDMNEPADFTGDEEYRPEFTVPNTLIAENDGAATSFRRFHNLYGTGMNIATRLATTLHRPEDRGFVLTRAGYAGIQRRAAIWTGDNHSWWEHLAASVPMLCGMGLSGLSFVGADAGGFQDNASPELYARWIAAAAFTPFYRGHSVCDSDPHEPWSFGPDALEISRRYLRLRYALLPYIYTAFRTAAASGMPVMRALLLHWPEDPRSRRENYEYLFGPSILVAPVFLPDQVKRHVYLPPGEWWEFWTGERFGGGDYLLPAPPDTLPLFARGGSIIPREEPRLHTDAPVAGPLSLEIYPDSAGGAAGELYEDAGEGWGYLDGEYLLLRFEYRSGELTVEVEGNGVRPRWEELLLRLHLPANGSPEPFGGAVTELTVEFPSRSTTVASFS